MMTSSTWWKEAVVYQIYPRSFQDSNGDGIGDLRGIIARLDYLEALGVDVIWLSPVYQSPNDDNGYDISDYQAIMAEFGTMADFDELLEGLHRRGMKLLMDLVVNHTSDEHPWFVESRRSRDNPKRDWYIWRPGKADGREPNNWESFFGGSAWQYDEATGEYYLHLFSKKQPDLNWENPEVREAVYRMMHWWLAKGIDGFRMDVINMISKVPELPDAPVTGPGPYQFGGRYFLQGPRLLEFLREMKDRVLSHYDVFTVGEMPLITTEHAVDLIHSERGALSMLFHFEHVMLDQAPDDTLGKWAPGSLRLTDLKQVMTRWQKTLEGEGWNSFYLSNHDQPRSVSRFGDDGRYRVESAKLLATFIHTLHGTPYVYQGEEIGMTNVPFSDIGDYRDIETLNFYRKAVEDMGLDPSRVMSVIQARSRDNARTPMQWDASANAGFTSGTPWIRINPNHADINVERDRADPDSILHYYRRLIRLRREHPVIVHGRYDLLLDDHEQIYAYTRTLENERLLVILNFSAGAPVFELPGHIDATNRTLLIHNYPADQAGDIRRLTLRPYEARVYRIGRA
ncbi:MAG: alpha-glucosidase [Candidatus Competibacterales bacterium]|nr:alpha-glucosidase [Candidatus Competibacterales bacterium]